MKKNSTSQSGIFTPRVLVALALCSCGVLLGMFSLVATPLSVPADPANFLSPSMFGSNANRLPPGVPLPPGTQFSVNGQGDPSSSSPTAGFPPPGRNRGTASGANSLGNPVLANQQPAPLSVQQAAASESIPFAPAASGDWSIVNSPNTSAVQGNQLNGVTCVSASECWAVGTYFNGSGVEQTLIERWDGTSWAIVSSPNTSTTQANFLLGVRCASASECWAVGYYVADIVGQTQFAQTLIERWDGTSWAIVTSPNTLAVQHNALEAVTCVSASNCWAVGYYNNGSAAQTLIERWDGTSWAIVSSPSTLATQPNGLYGVTCVSASNCWAVGVYVNGSSTYQTLIERWDGTSWAIVSSPNTGATQYNVLTGVTCVSASECWAVGYYYTGSTGPRTLIERWDGSSWAIVTSPNPLTTLESVLFGVTCVSAGADCWAVGYSFNDNRAAQTLIERWDGTSWAIVSSPNTNPTPNNVLSGVTCVSASNCWAVGYYNAGRAKQTLIERWDGSSWTIVTSPNTDYRRANLLYGVTCVSASECWAAGYYDYYDGSAYQTLIERWDGTSWAIVSSPSNKPSETTCILSGQLPGCKQDNFLYGLTCVSASDCWAVGTYSVSNIDQTFTEQTLVERWDGTSWAIVTSPNTSATQDNLLTAATCVSASNCWAVGYYINANGNYQTLTERWDGTSWTIVSSPSTSASQDNILSGVTCVSAAADCWAVGYSFTGSANQTLIEHWNGTAWTIVTSPNSSTTQQNFLTGATCVSASDCWAVGRYLGDSAYQTLIERWDGTSWAIVTSPNTSTTVNNELLGVTCVSASDCWAIGYYGSTANDIRQTLVLRYTASPPPTPTSVVSRKTHGTAGDFDIDLPLAGNPGIECRSGGSNNDYQMVVTFANAVTFNSAAVTSGTGSVSSTTGSGTTAVTVNLTGVTNAQTITLTLSGVNDGTKTGDVGVRMGVLVGDTNADGTVNSADITQVRRQSGNVAHGDPAANFREDTTTDGTIDSADITQVRRQSGTALP